MGFKIERHIRHRIPLYPAKTSQVPIGHFLRLWQDVVFRLHFGPIPVLIGGMRHLGCHVPSLRGFLFLFLCVLSIVLRPPSAQAHRVSSVSLISYLNTKDRTYTLDAAMEVVPSEDPALNDQISPEDAAREFASYLIVMFDQAEQKPEMEISVEETSDEDTPEELRRRQVLTKMKGKFPESAKEFLLYLDPRCPMAVVMVVVKDEQPSRRMQVILAGEYSRPVSVLPTEEGDPFTQSSEGAAAPTAPGAAPATAPALEAPASTSGPAAPTPTISAFTSGWRSFLHESALPAALVIGMLLLTLGRTSVLWQAGAILLGQGLAVAAAAWGLVTVPSWSWMGLAAVVGVVAIEALLHHQVKPWRYPLVAVGGIFLGLSLIDTDAYRGLIAGGDLGTGRLILFLLGTEAAFFLVILVGAANLLSLSRFAWYRKSVVTPLAVLVAGYGLFTIVERFL